MALVKRKIRFQRKTNETAIAVVLNLDGTGKAKIKTGLHFFDHMLDQLAKHSGIDLEIKAVGDLEIDEHHTIEDTAITIGEAFRQAMADKRGMERYGFEQQKKYGLRSEFLLPMDEALVSCALDFSGRAYFIFEGSFKREKVGDFPTELFTHFFHTFCQHAGLNLHLTIRGENDHHKIEASFKAFARSIKQALKRVGDQLPSTKGSL